MKIHLLTVEPSEAADKSEILLGRKTVKDFLISPAHKAGE